MRTVVKKIVIKNRRLDGSGQQADADNYFNSSWEEISSALKAVLQGERPRIPFDRVFRNVEDLCRHKREQDVYRKLMDLCEKYLTEEVLPSIKASGKGSDVEMLEAVLSEWEVWSAKSVRCPALIPALPTLRLPLPPFLLETLSLLRDFPVANNFGPLSEDNPF